MGAEIPWNLFSPMLFTGLCVAFLHSSLPTHWLPFITASRLNRWSKFKTLSITGLAGLGHVVFTAVLGALIVWFGVGIDEWIGGWFHFVAAGILFGLGAYYIGSHLKKDGHGHCGAKSDRMTIISLFLVLTFSPCEAFLPVYLSGIRFGWMAFVFLSGALALGTAVGMTGFTWLALQGMAKIRVDALERYESMILGILLCLLGLGTVFLE